MSRFLRDAIEIFEAAQSCADSGPDASDWTILVGPAGEVTLKAACDWPLDALQAHHGSRMVFRVSQQENNVRVEGRAGCRTCLFETARPDGAARHLLADPPEALLRRPVAIPLTLAATGALLPPEQPS